MQIMCKKSLKMMLSKHANIVFAILFGDTKITHFSLKW